MLVLSERVGNGTVNVLSDTGCSGIIVSKSFLNETDMTGEMGHMMTGDRTIKSAPIDRIIIDTPYYAGVVDAFCLLDSLFDLII